MEATKTPLIKPGWVRATLYAVGILLIIYVLQIAGSYITSQLHVGTEKGDDALISFAVSYGLMGLLVLLFTWFMRKFADRKSMQSLGYTWKGFSNEAGLGFFCALAILGTGSLILVATGNISFISATLDPVNFVIEIIMMIIVAFVEELIFRGYLLNNLLESTNKWVALAISSVLFALFHQANPDVSFFAIINILLAGLLLGLNYIFTKNLWFSMCFHFAWNYFQGPVLGYEVSGLKLTSLLQQANAGSEMWTGGLFGFEGSLLCPVLSLIAFIIFAFLFINRYKAVSNLAPH